MLLRGMSRFPEMCMGSHSYVKVFSRALVESKCSSFFHISHFCGQLKVNRMKSHIDNCTTPSPNCLYLKRLVFLVGAIGHGYRTVLNSCLFIMRCMQKILHLKLLVILPNWLFYLYYSSVLLVLKYF